MYDRISNTESDVDLKTRAMAYVLREVCSKYKKKRDPTFSQEEIHGTLQGLGPEYINLNIRDLFEGSGYIEIDENLNLRLNDKGRQDCENEQVLLYNDMGPPLSYRIDAIMTATLSMHLHGLKS